jgi:redox-sensing transcriptional repressor
VKNFTIKSPLPPPALERLSYLYSLLARLETETHPPRITSRRLGELLSVPGETIRKDISFLGGRTPVQTGQPEQTEHPKTSPRTAAAAASREKGYDPSALKNLIGERLGLGETRTACLVGLGRLGSAILGRGALPEERRYRLTAAFDASINRIELTQTDIPLFHSAEISRVVREKNIKLGIIAVPAAAASDVAKRLIAGGVQGIVNFAPVNIPRTQGIAVRNISLTGELDIISAYINAHLAHT